MKEDCEALARKAEANQLERARFGDPSWLFPCSKGHRPFLEWSIDCIVNLKPPDAKGRTACVVCVDCFTKWVVAVPLDDMTSRHMAQVIHTHIVC
jgi:hypothetical protein